MIVKAFFGFYGKRDMKKEKKNDKGYSDRDSVINDLMQCRVDFEKIRNTPYTGRVLTRDGVPILSKGSVSMITGVTGAMKSYMAFALAAAVLNDGEEDTLGKTFGFRAERAGMKTVFFDSEHSLEELALRLPVFKQMTDKIGDPRLSYVRLRTVKTDKMEFIRDYIRKKQPDVVIIDSIWDMLVSDDETTPFMNNLKMLAHKEDVAILTTICASRSNPQNPKGFFGSDLQRIAMTEILIEKPKMNVSTFYVSTGKNRNGPFSPFVVKFTEGEGDAPFIMEYKDISYPTRFTGNRSGRPLQRKETREEFLAKYPRIVAELAESPDRIGYKALATRLGKDRNASIDTLKKIVKAYYADNRQTSGNI